MLLEYVITYLAFSPVFAAVAAKDSHGVLASALWGLLWPLYLLVIVFYLVVTWR